MLINSKEGEKMNESNKGFRFERIEKKFWMTKTQFDKLSGRLIENMKRDEFGLSTICNIYYDTPDFALIRNSIERPLFKEKIRVRSYGIPNESSPVFVEVKKKLNGIGYKRRITVPFCDAKKLMNGIPVYSSQPQIEKEILDFINRYHPEPQVFLTYKRIALSGKDDPDFRVTIDSDLKYKFYNEHIPLDDNGDYIMDDKSMILMEIKSSCAIPEWLLSEMSKLKIYQAPFSKIGTCYLKHIAPNTNGGKINNIYF